jgi:hypothetical protein
MSTRKPVAAVRLPAVANDSEEFESLTVVCDDGSVWTLCNGTWFEFVAIPGTYHAKTQELDALADD